MGVCLNIMKINNEDVMVTWSFNEYDKGRMIMNGDVVVSIRVGGR